MLYVFGFGSSLEFFQLKSTTFMLFHLACYSYVHLMLHILIVLITRGELVLCSFIYLLKPTGHVMHHQFNIQQLYALPTLYLRVLYLRENKQRLVPLTA